MSPYLLAFVGQNESGKSSVLTGLEWLSEEEETPLDNLDRARTNQKDTGWIVGAEFALGDAEIDLLNPLGFEEVPTAISIWKQADGKIVTAFRGPRDPKRDPAPFTAASTALARAEQRLRKQIHEAGVEPDEDEEDQGPEVWIGRLSDLTIRKSIGNRSISGPRSRWRAGSKSRRLVVRIRETRRPRAWSARQRR